MDVFHDQKFLLRNSTGERFSKSFCEIITGPDEPLLFDYPVEYMNIAAMELCAALAQTALEPDTRSDLVGRIRTPMDKAEFEACVAPYLDDFSIDGTMRFMQGSTADDNNPPSPESMTEALLTVRKGSSVFLNRPHERWTVRLNQLPLFLFSRATFTEKQGGRGYLAGTSKDMEVRTCLIDTTSLRRSVWLNVLCRVEQERYAGSYPLAGTPDSYDTWLWKKLPDGRKLPQHKVTLRAGLLWMVARHLVTLAELAEPAVCIATGLPIPAGEKVGIAIDKSSVGVGYGEDRNEDEPGATAFFYHPNAPYENVTPKDGRPEYPRHFTVDEHARLVEIMGGLFFSNSDKKIWAAPVLQQLKNMTGKLPEYGGGAASRLQLQCFGFHMLTAQKSVHGGYEAHSFSYPLVGINDADPQNAQEQAFDIIVGSAHKAEELLGILAYAVRMCTMTKVDTLVESQGESGRDRIKIVPKPKERLDTYNAYMRDLTVEYWAQLNNELQLLLQGIHEHGSTHDELVAHREALHKQWEKAATGLVQRLFFRVFNDYVTAPGYLLAAHNAKRFFYQKLYKEGYISYTNSTPIHQSTEEIV